MLAGLALMLVVGAVLAGLWAGGVFGPGPGADKGGGAAVSERSEVGVKKGEQAKADKKGPVEKAAPEKKELARKEEEKKPAELAKTRLNTVGMKLVLIPAGKFYMGSTKQEQDEAIADYEKWGKNKASEEIIGFYRAEGPRHEVVISRPFYLGAYEVTQAEYEAVMEDNPSWFSAKGGGKDRVKGMDTSRFPVESVSHDKAVEFCRRLTEKERKEGKILPEQEYRLPTEAEWEYSCRGGAASKPFHFGDKLSATDANFDGRFPYGGGEKGEESFATRRVGSYQPNARGLYDMHGNVWEWCADWYDKGAYGADPHPRRDPLGPPKGSDRVVRGGSWDYFGQFCRSADRRGIAPADRSYALGFRVVLVSAGEK